MFRISEFSRLARVTVKTLRHYDRLGVLVPAHVDRDTRYRYYTAGQIGRLQRILALRALGFSLEHIADLLDEEHDGTAVRRLLERRRDEAERQLEESRRVFADVDARLRAWEERPGADAPDVVLQPLPPVRVASRRRRVDDLDDAVAELFEELEAGVARAGTRAAGPPLLLYHDRDFRERGADVEAAVPVVETALGALVHTLPAVPMAACWTYAGGYEGWPVILRTLLEWLEERHLAPAGPLRETYLQFRATDTSALPPAYLAERTGDLLTEMQIPVREVRRLARQRTSSRAKKKGTSAP